MVTTDLLCESCRLEQGVVLLVVRGESFRVCTGCAVDPDRELRS